SFTAAARSLGMPKSSVSRAVSRLEEQLGERLIERTTRQLKLTMTGRAYYDGAVRALAALTDAEQFVAESQGEPRGTVRLTVPATMDRSFLSETVTSFTKRYPAIHLDVSFNNRLVDLVAEGFDIGLRGARGGRLQGGSLISRKVARLSLWLFAAPSYLKLRTAPRRPEDLEKHDLILFDPHGSISKTVELLGPKGRESVEINAALSSDCSLVVRELVLRGAGITFMVPRVDDLRSGTLVRVLPEYQLPDVSLFVIMPSNRHLPHRVALFRDALIDAFKTFPSNLDASIAKAQPTGT